MLTKTDVHTKCIENITYKPQDTHMTHLITFHHFN